MPKRIGFISTRFQGIDGVSLETSKWVSVLESIGYECYFFSGLSDWRKERSMVVPEAFFNHPEIKQLHSECYGKSTRSTALTQKIQQFRKYFKKHIYDFIRNYKIDLLIVENALTIPINIPLGLAITEVIAETGIFTIAHHHDFVWERQRFIVNSVTDYITMAFPPRLPSVLHVVINTAACQALSHRCGISSLIIPNVFDYSAPIPGIDDYNRGLRKSFGLKDSDIFFLQPTRIIARKGIEHAIELVSRLKDDRIKILISHQERDEGTQYYERVISYANLLNVNVIIKPELVGSERGKTDDGRKVYSLTDIYLHADFITYPSTYEGFGNAFLETVYYKKPFLVNRYAIYQQDIEPLGFQAVVMDTYITDEDVENVRAVLADEKKRQNMVDNNFKIASRNFSYKVLERQLKILLPDGLS
ncbi:MAG: glycosyltransferase family 4 protein [Spirochaetales bacterium]|nr:glycosyltransferase family 4 protein [Spirochaetales bacterium]